MLIRLTVGIICLLPYSLMAKTVHYDLVARQKFINLSGKETVDFAIAINDQIPAPTLEFVEGDDAEIVVTNQVRDQELSVHWHGILLPPEMDGVPYVTTPPIKFGESFTFRFRLRQSGTYWYHSHTHVQEQKGVFGAFIVRPKTKPFAYNKEVVAVLSDWSDENAESILSNLRKDGDYYLFKKGTMRSWLGAIGAGALGSFLSNEWSRMGGMDYSDVGYDAFLINGKKESQLLDAKSGDSVRIRIINAAASTYFHVALGDVPMKVVSADGLDVAPVVANELLMGMAETYDVLFELPAQKNFQLKSTSQDGTGSASAWIGAGEKVAAPTKPFPNQYASMDHSGHGGGHASHGTTHSENPGMAMPHAGHSYASHVSTGPLVQTLTVNDLKSNKTTALPKNAPVYDLKLSLGGDMERYIWHINGKAIHQERTIEIKEGDVVRFTFENKTMMHHPMHLHGHFFRVLTDAGDFSPLKHTVDVPPHGSRTIEFLANEPGEWMLHCHNLYHMMTGMGRVVKYISYTPKPEMIDLQSHDAHHNNPTYFSGQLEVATNHGQGRLRLSKTWDELDARFEIRKDFGWGVEGDLFYHRWFNQYFNLVLGGANIEGNYRAVAGVSYLLPLLIRATLLMDHRAELRIDLEKRFQWSKYFFSDVDLTWRQSLDSEVEITLMYSPNWHWAGGLMVTEKSIGAGLNYRF